MQLKTTLAVGFVVVCGLAARADEPQPNAKKPPYERLLQGDDAKRAAELKEKIEEAEKADQYDEAIELSERLFALRVNLQGGDHWETVNQKWRLDRVRKVARLSPEDRERWREATRRAIDIEKLMSQGKFTDAQSLCQKFLDLRREFLGDKHRDIAESQTDLAVTLYSQRNFAAAQTLFQAALDLYRELLGEKHPDTAMSYDSLAAILNDQDKYADAQPFLQAALDIRREVLGEDHSDTASSYKDLAVNLYYQKKHVDAQPNFQRALDLNRQIHGETHSKTAQSYKSIARNLYELGKYADAQPLFEKALDICREIYGEKHADTASSYNNLASTLNMLGKSADAQPLIQKALDIRREVFGENHVATATSYMTLAENLRARGLCEDAHPLYQRALDIRRELLGEKNPETATAYSNLAENLRALGKYAEAQPLYKLALNLRRELLGERDSDTAMSYSNLAANLMAQGRYADAQPLLQKSLTLFRELRGETHPDTATSYNNLAMILNAQDKYHDAEPLLQKAHELYLALLGEDHPYTATNYNNLAANLNHQRKYADAQVLYQKAYDVRLRLLGENHPDTATSSTNLAGNLYDQGNYADALPLFEKALTLHRQVLGEKHPITATTYNRLARNLSAQGMHVEALRMLERAAETYEAARLEIAGRGLDRAVFGASYSPYRLLAVTEARLHSAEAAFAAIETDMARGLSDDMAPSRGSALNSDERESRAKLTSRLAALQPRILKLVSQRDSTDADRGELLELQTERTTLESGLAKLAVALSQREVATLAQVQGSLGVDVALVLWVDISAFGAGGVDEHWGCVVRQTGKPAWERLPGTGLDGAWTSDDDALPKQVRTAIVGNDAANIAGLADELYAQRLAPLAKYLKGVKSLCVVAVNEMAGLPIEVLTSEFTISYVPSGTFLSHSVKRGRTTANGILALGDPVFKRFDGKSNPKSPSDLPSSGLLITAVAPDGIAAKAQLRSDDVLVRYGDTEINTYDQLVAAIQAHATDKEIQITVWREGLLQPFTRNVSPGRLGVGLNREPARDVIMNRRQSDAMLTALRGGNWNELPGTRVELMQLSKLFDGDVQFLVDSAAAEQSLDELRKNGNLSQYRYLHFATHGEANNVKAFESVLILAQDKLPEDPLPRAGEPFINGQLSANEVLEFWKLNADLVTLSACETALGRKGGGDGLLGFAQAFLAAGSRAVCLSLWKVDDTATSLLMTRFYQNLLGKRDGLKQPMGKARALAEAKEWLRELSKEESEKLLTAAQKGVDRPNRGKDEVLKPVTRTADSKEPAGKRGKPFAHPRYWSAFILIGDPN